MIGRHINNINKQFALLANLLVLKNGPKLLIVII